MVDISLSMDFFAHLKINTPSLFEFLTLFQDTARFFVLGSQENSVSEKKKTSLDCRFNTQTADAHPREKTTNTKDGNTPAPDLYEISHLGRFQPHLPCSHLPHTKFNTESTIFVDISAFKRLAPIRQSPPMGKPCHHRILQMHRTCSQHPLGNTLYLT
jgi:hypothetical protein